MADKVIFVNGNFHSFDRKTHGAQVIAVEDGLIIDAGTNVRIKPLSRRGFKTIDLKKQTAIPGLIDSHLHLMSLGTSFKRVNLDGVDSLDKARKLLREAAAAAAPAHGA